MKAGYQHALKLPTFRMPRFSKKPRKLLHHELALHVPCFGRYHATGLLRCVMTFQDASSQWFLAQLKPNAAALAERNLKRQGFRTFLPLEEHTRQRNGKFVTSTRPFFPGYIFVSFDAVQGHWRAINSTQGITRLVSFGRAPAEVPEDLIAHFMARCDKTGKMVGLDHLKTGDQVTVTKGPFADFAAEVEKINADQRVWVLLDVMGGKTRVAVNAEHLRPV